MKKKTRLKALLLAFVTVVSCTCMLWSVPSSAANSGDATVQAYEQQLADYEAKRAEAEQKAAATQNDINQVMVHKQALDQSISYTIQKMAVAESMIAELEAKIEANEELIEQTEQDMEDRREAFLGRVVALHEDGNASYLELILGAESIAMFLSRVDYVNSMMEYDHKVISELKEAKETIKKSQEEIEASIETTEATLAQLENDRAYYADAVLQSDSALNSLMNDKAAYDAESQKYAALEESLNGELSTYLAQRQEETNKTFVGGEYMWPVPVNGTYISSHFGWRNLNGAQDYHAATDIPGATGTPIYASNGGEVVRSEWHDSYGNYVLIDHGGGYSTLYAHMSARYVSAGQTVSQGDNIGAVGNTGYSFGSHLHFEFRVNGERVNPLIHVPAPY